MNLTTDLKIILPPKSSGSAAAPATAFWRGYQGGSFAAALQGAPRIFMVSACPSAGGHERLLSD